MISIDIWNGLGVQTYEQPIECLACVLKFHDWLSGLLMVYLVIRLTLLYLDLS